MNKLLKKDDRSKLISFVNNKEIFQLVKSSWDEEEDFSKYFEEPHEYLIDNGRFKKYITENVYVTKISPYTKADIRRMSKKNFIVVNETPEMYQKMFDKWISKEIPVEWIHNILNAKSEKENVLLQEKDFILTKDLKWNGKKDSMYLLVIFRDESLYSIRSLTDEHLNLLKKTKKIVIDYCFKNFGYSESELKMYFHYHPSYWHLHLHVQYVGSMIGKDSCFYAEKLDDVIYNLELTGDYYKKKTIILMQDTETLKL